MYVSTPLAATIQLRVTAPLTTCLLKILLFKLSTVKFVSGVVLKWTKRYYYGLRPSSCTHLHTFRKLDLFQSSDTNRPGLLNPLETQENRDSVAVRNTLATGWTSQGSNPGRGKKGFSSPDRPNRLWGPSKLLFMVYRGSFLKVKRPSAKVKKSGGIPPRLHGLGSSNLPLPQKHNLKQWTSNCADQLTIKLYR
jgi:hypothetical protein